MTKAEGGLGFDAPDGPLLVDQQRMHNRRRRRTTWMPRALRVAVRSPGLPAAPRYPGRPETCAALWPFGRRWCEGAREASSGEVREACTESRDRAHL
jgi:hypothetical protein